MNDTGSNDDCLLGELDVVVATVDVVLEEARGGLPHDEITKAAIVILMRARLGLTLLVNLK